MRGSLLSKILHRLTFHLYFTNRLYTDVGHYFRHGKNDEIR